VLRRLATLVVVALGLSGAFELVGPGVAFAHEERTVGAYHFAVGFGSEPAYTGEQNSVQLLLSDSKGNPVTDLGDSLKVEVGYGNQTLSLNLEPFFEVGEFGTPGDYRAWFFPTQPGDYTFHFTGSIKGQQVDESFTSGPQTFSSVEDPSAVQFPVKVPTVGEVATRLDRETPRLASKVAAAKADVERRADKARTVGIIGLAVGAIGLVVGVVALVTARRRHPTTAPGVSEGGGS
jgi:hypothetical protein